MFETTIQPIAIIHSEFKEKFGIPRQSLLVPELKAEIVFEKEYASPAAVRGLEEFSHIWLIWGFSKSQPVTGLTVHPPRLGGKVKKGVFATRSPYRPNGLGLSVVKLEQVDAEEGNVKLIVSGADLLDGTPIYDVKPYMPYSDSIEDAKGGFGQKMSKNLICVECPDELLAVMPEDIQTAVIHLLEQDPRAAYNKEPGYVFGMSYAGFDVRFTATDEKITVIDIVKNNDDDYKKIK